MSIVQDPTTSLADDVAVTKRTLAVQNGPVHFGRHLYGGVVITEAGDDPKVTGLVTSLRSPRTRASRFRADQEPAARCACAPILRLRMAICCSTGHSFKPRSRLM